MATTPSISTRLRTLPASAFAAAGSRFAAAVPLKSIPSRQPIPQAAHLLALQKEPEDASLTGGTRSLDRRLLALNLYGRAFKAKMLPPRSAATQLPCTSAA